MPLVQAKCPNCGGNLQVDNAKDAAICRYCGSPFIVEKAINYYTVTNHISGSTVNIYGGNSVDFVIRAGTLEKYAGASTKVVIPNTVAIIGYHAFYNCAALKSVVIPDSVTSIVQGAFEGCSSLTRITIPNSVQSIGNSAFRGCSALTDVTIGSGLRSIGNDAFHSCFSLTRITIPHNSVQIIGGGAFSHCSALSGCFTIPNNVTSIGWYAFQGCTGLTGVTIPTSVTSIGQGAFEGCTGLTSVTIPTSVTIIGSGAFRGCSKLVTVNKPPHISDNAFSGSAWYAAKYATRKANENKGGCYVATAVYGSYDCPEVWVLRRFRDDSLAESRFGRLFIALYYAVSPAVVRRFGSAEWFNRRWKARLDRLVKRLKAKGFADTPYQDKN